MTVTDWSEKLYQWREYAEVLCPLRDEVSDIFETKCFYDDKWEYHEKFYEADDDTVSLLKLSDMLHYDDAIDKVREAWRRSEYVLDADDFIEAGFEIVGVKYS